MSQSEKVLVIDLSEQCECQKLLDGEPQTCGMRSGRVYLQPGEACGQHNTNHYEEMLVFLSGSGQLLISEENSFQVGKGKVSYIPPNTIHDVKNIGSEPLIYIYCVASVNGQLSEKSQ